MLQAGVMVTIVSRRVEPRMLPKKTLRIFSLIEGFAFSVFIALFIWRLQFSHPNSWVVFPLWLVISFVIHRDTP